MSNLGYATIAVAPSPATSGTSLTVANGLGSLFPSSNFTVTIYPPNTPPLASNAEICLVSSRTGDVFTIVRAQEGTTAKTIATGWQIANTATKIAFTDIQNAMIQFVSAGSTKAGASEVVFSNSNGISFGANGQTITAAVAAGVGGAAISAAGSSQGTGTVVFSNSNGVTFGMNGGTITASVPAAGSINFSAGTQSSNLNSLVFSNTNNVSFGLSNGTLTGSVGAIVVAAGSSIKSDGLVVFANSNSISFGMDGIGNVTASISFPAGSGGVGISAGGASQSTGTVVFSNSNGVSFGLNAGTVTASHNGLSSQSNQAASASNGSFAFQTLGFADANGVTFGTSAGSIVTASIAASAAGSINFSAGTQSSNLSGIVFSNSNGVSFGLSNGTITGSVASATGGGGASYVIFEPFPLVSTGPFAQGINAMQLAEFSIPANMNAAFGRVMVTFAATASNIASTAIAAATVTYGMSNNFSFGLYTYGSGASSNSLSLASSGSALFAWSNGLTITNSTQYTANMGLTYPSIGGGGSSSSSFQTIVSASQYSFNASTNFAEYSSQKFVDVPLLATITPGNYVVGFASGSSTQSGSTGANITAIQNPKLSGVSFYVISGPSGFNFFMGYTSGSGFALRVGDYSTFANSLNRTDIGVVGNNRKLYFQIGA